MYLVGVNCYKWKMGCYDCTLEPGYTVSKYMDRSRSLYELGKRLFSQVMNMTIVPVSDWQASFLKDSFLSHHNIHTIRNGIASPWNTRKGLSDFCRLSSMLPSEEFTIILVGLKPE